MLIEALEGWFETASAAEVASSIPVDMRVEELELAVG